MLLREILRQLELTAPYSVPSGALRAAVRASLGKVGDEEFAEALNTLLTKGRISKELDELTDDTRWSLKA